MARSRRAVQQALQSVWQHVTGHARATSVPAPALGTVCSQPHQHWIQHQSVVTQSQHHGVFSVHLPWNSPSAPHGCLTPQLPFSACSHRSAASGTHLSISQPHQHLHHYSSSSSDSATSASTVPAGPQPDHPLAAAMILPHVPNPMQDFKRPEDAVGKHSKLLLRYAYKKGLTPRQLVGRVMRRPGINNLQNLLKLYQRKMDGIVIAAVLTKIVQTHQRTRKSEQKQLEPVIHNIMTWLRPYLQFQIRYCAPKTLATILWAWSRLPASIRGSHVWPQDTAALLFARACAPHKTGDPQLHKLRKVSPQTLALLAWAPARLLPADYAQSNPMVQAACKELRHHAARRINQFSPQGLSLLAGGLAALSAAEASTLLTQCLAVDAAGRIGNIIHRQFRAQELVRLLRACGACGFQHQGLFERVVGALLPSVERWPRADVVALREALQSVGIQHEELNGKIEGVIRNQKAARRARSEQES